RHPSPVPRIAVWTSRTVDSGRTSPGILIRGTATGGVHRPGRRGWPAWHTPGVPRRTHAGAGQPQRLTGRTPTGRSRRRSSPAGTAATSAPASDGLPPPALSSDVRSGSGGTGMVRGSGAPPGSRYVDQRRYVVAASLSDLNGPVSGVVTLDRW